MSTDPVFMKIGSEYYWYHNDQLGTPQMMTTSSGAVVWSARYSSFGDVQALPESAVANNLRFSGQYNDSETGLHYNRYRYYDPEVGRYIRTDPIRASINFYAYGYNNPLFFIDPFGLDADAVFMTWIKGGAYNRNGIIRRKPMSREYERQGLEYLSKFALALSELESAGVDVHALTDEELDEIYNAIRDYYRDVYAVATSTTFCLHGILQKLKNAAPKNSLDKARIARDKLAKELGPLPGRKRPATVTAGYNTKTGEVAARACGGGKCAENHVVEALGGDKSKVKFTEAARPRPHDPPYREVPVCPNCEKNYGRDAFPDGTIFKSDL